SERGCELIFNSFDLATSFFRPADVVVALSFFQFGTQFLESLPVLGFGLGVERRASVPKMSCECHCGVVQALDSRLRRWSDRAAQVARAIFTTGISEQVRDVLESLRIFEPECVTLMGQSPVLALTPKNRG